MTKRYILPTWEELSKTERGRLVDEVEYKEIREATAVEDGLSPLATDALVKFAKGILQKQNRETLASLKADDTVTIVMDAPQFVHLWYLAHGEESPLIEESERLVGKARGEDGGVSFAAALRMMDAVFGPRRGEIWVDVGGGEEKPVREAQQPATDRPRCENCRFGHVVKNPINDGVMCQRFPQHRFIDIDDALLHWCGEWRAK